MPCHICLSFVPRSVHVNLIKSYRKERLVFETLVVLVLLGIVSFSDLYPNQSVASIIFFQRGLVSWSLHAFRTTEMVEMVKFLSCSPFETI